MPEKTIYSINEKGRLYFIKLMEKYSQEPGMVYIDFAAFTANLHHLDFQEGYEMVKTLQNRLAVKQEMVKANIEEKKESVPQHAFLMLDLYNRMYSLFYDWLEEFAKDYVENHKS
jgi:DNA-binding PadR family transcriptional regulator